MNSFSEQNIYQPAIEPEKIGENQLLNAKDWTYLYLLPPQALLNSEQLSQPVKVQIESSLQQLKETLAVEKPTQAIAIINELMKRSSNAIETVLLEKEFSTGTSLKHQHAQEFDHYMQVVRVKPTEPAKLIIASVLQAYEGFLEVNESWPLEPTEVKLLKMGFQSYADLLARTFNLPIFESENNRNESSPATGEERAIEYNSPLQAWKKSHWVFIVFCQALIVCQTRFVDAVKTDNLDVAKIELQTAAELMWASGAAMKLAGSFSKQIYESEVRPTMTLGNPQSQVQSKPLSGLMMWEHDYLVNAIWKQQLCPILQTLPATFQAEHEEFIRAYQQGLSSGHKSVCAKFGGGEIAALTASHLPINLAVPTLEKFEESRLKMLDPHSQANGRCPAHKHRNAQ